MRIGHGFDVHRFSDDMKEEGYITLGGVRIEHTHALLAHSDGDVLLHAICDALLGAAALGDIGQHFPDTDTAYKGIDSRQLLRHVAALLNEHGYALINLDSTIVAQFPKMAPHINAMKAHLAKDLKVSMEQVNVKATTTEKLGYTGRGEGIAAHAVVIISG